jgi:hypothetical protein
MKIRALSWLALATALAAPAAVQAQVSIYSQNFDTLPLAAPVGESNSALSDDGWEFFVNVYNADWSFAYNYGVFPAPNSLGGISAVGAGGEDTAGDLNMGVFSDYFNSSAHLSGQWVQTSVFQLQTVAPSDVGSQWVFQFDARWFNLAAPSTALAFIQTLDPGNGQASGTVMLDMSAVPDAWGTYSLPFTITAAAGSLLQFGFLNTATNFDDSGVVYDNISLTPVPEPGTYALMFAGLGVMGWAARRRSR